MNFRCLSLSPLLLQYRPWRVVQSKIKCCDKKACSYHPTLLGVRAMASDSSSTSPSGSPIVLDGSELEGGGQILRMAIGYSGLLGQPIRVEKIRGQRPKPGLKAQHLNGLLLVRDVCRGNLEGGAIDSMQITFHPGCAPLGRGAAASSYLADTKTAGNVTLLLQASLPCLLFADGPSTVDLRGGTHAAFAPTTDFYRQAFFPNLRRFLGQDLIRAKVLRNGYFPRGGGQFEVEVDPVSECLAPVVLLDAGRLVRVKITASVAGSLPVRLAEEMAQAALKRLKKSAALRDATDAAIERDVYKERSAVGNGSSVMLCAETSTGCVLGASGLGSPKQKPFVTGEEAAEELLSSLERGVCVDEHVQDQLIIYMALADGESRLRTGPLTLHTKTAIHVSQLMTGAKFEVSEEPDKLSVVIKCRGIGLRRSRVQDRA